MKTPARIGLYGLALVAVVTVALTTAGAVVPEGTEHDGHAIEEPSPGLGLAQDGYQLTGVSAPDEAGTDGELFLTITGSDGNPVTDFDLEHEKELHLIVVRADGQHFRHVHPEREAEGTWSIPWAWEAAGSYRIFADFVPTETGEGITLSTSVQVAGDYVPELPTEQATTTTADGFEASVDGDLEAGESVELTMTITRDGEPVTALEPYLGAYGHLVALRDGDLAYLHAHPHGEEPQEGETSGPEIVFEATAPTPGRYLLYLDFQVDGEVHTAELVVNTVGAATDYDDG